MATKKKGSRDDFNFDDDLDFDIPDFPGDASEPLANNRKPITTGLKSAASGFGKTFISEARLRQTLKKSLPKEYEESISKAGEIKDGFSDLYNIGSGQAKQFVKETKRATGRIGRSLDGVLPKKLSDAMQRFGDSADEGERKASKDEVEQGTIDSAFAEIFTESVRNDAENRKTDNARAILQDSIDKKRHADMTSLLGSIDQSLLSQTAFQDKITTNYMKKSLELQFRTYFVQNDMLQLQSKFFQLFKDDLAAITKNTGLPDYVKKAPKEALFELMRAKTFDSLSNTIAKKRNQWLSGAFKKAGKKINEVGDNIREGASQVFDVAEMMASMQESGMGPSAAEMAGDLAGGAAGNKVQDYLAKLARKHLSKNPAVLRGGNKSKQIAGALPQWVNNQVQNGKYSDKIPDWLRDILAMEGETSQIRVNREVDLDRAAQFSDKNSRSINIVIPELLSMINSSIQGIGGRQNGPMVKYDYEKGKFVTQKQRNETLAKTVVSDRTVKNTKADLDRLFEEIDPNKTLSEEEKKSISENIYKSNKAGTYFDRDTMSSENTLGDSDAGRKASALVKEFMDKSSHGSGERRMSRIFGRVGAQNGEVVDVIQHLIDTGRQGELEDIGLIDLKTGRINMEAVRNLELGGKFKGQDDSPTVVPPKPTVFENIKNAVKGKKKGQQPTLIPEPAPSVETPGSMKEAVKLLRDVAKSMEKIRPAEPGDNTRLIEVVEQFSGKTELTEIRDILLRMEAAGGMGGGPGGGGGGGGGSGPGGWLGKFGHYGSKILGGGFKGLWKGARGSWDLSSKIVKGGAGLFGKGASMASKWLAKAKEDFDLFVGDEVEPRLSKAKLNARRYVDAATGNVIEKFEDIVGDVKDLDTDKIVLRANEIKDSVLKNIEKGKAKLVSGLGWGKEAISKAFQSAKKTAQTMFGWGKSIHSMAWNGAKLAYEHLTDGPMDVYLKDSYETPVLLKRIMADGRYFNKTSLDAITKVSEIKDAVLDNEGNVLITKEDLAKGLYDKDGQEIKTGTERIKQLIGGSMKKAISAYKNMLGKAKDMMGGALGWVSDLFGGGGFSATSKKTNDILSAIYALLNDRMPGDRHPDLDQLVPNDPEPKPGAGPGGKIKGAFDKLKEKSKGWIKTADEKRKEVTSEEYVDGKKTQVKQAYKKAKNKAEVMLEQANERRKQFIGDEYIEDKKDKAKGKYKAGKDKVISTWDKLYKLIDERLPGKGKKTFDDEDGNGVRDNSFDDLRSKREKAIAKAKELKDKGMAGGKSIYGAGAEALAKYLKKREQAEEDDDDDGGDTFIDNSSGEKKAKTPQQLKDEKRKRRIQRLRDARPKGRMGRGWDAIKKKMTPGAGSRTGRMLGGAARMGRGLAGGALGTAVRGVGGFGLRAAGMWGLSLLTGGLASASMVGTLGSMAMGGLGMIGSVLGMTATAIGAIVSSPITVPLLAIAAVGTAGYFAYKWLTKPDPQPLEKVRLVQYGWKSTDIDAYKKMKTIEDKVKGAVVFKGENAEFDKSRINLGDLMKVYDLDPKNEDHAKKFVGWFADRFRPIYLNHRALVKIQALPKELEDIDSNKADVKKRYLEQCAFPGEHYAVRTSPYKDQEFVTTSLSSVETEIGLAKAAVEAEGTTKKDDKKTAEKTAVAATATAATVAAMQQKKDLADAVKTDAQKVPGVPNQIGGDKSPASAAMMTRLAAATVGANLPGAPGDANNAPGNPINGPAGPNGQSTQQPAGQFNGGINIRQPGKGSGGDINNIPIPKGNGSWAALKDTIVAASKMAGVDPKLSAAITAVESGFDASARPVNKKTGGYYSSAKGLNQFIDGTWKATLGKYGSKYGIDPATSAMDPRANALMGAEFIKENMAGLKKAVNRDLTATDVYIAHFMGLGGARKFLSADPNSSGAAIFPEAARANPWIYYKDPKTMTQPKMLSEIYGDFTQKLSKKLQSAGYNESDITGATQDPAKIQEENSRMQESMGGGGPAIPENKAGIASSGVVKPGTPISSPKPYAPDGVAQNANTGPVPAAYAPASQMTSSPRPSYDPATGNAAAAPTSRAPAVDPYYTQKSSANTGDNINFMKESAGSAKQAVDHLKTIVDLLTKLPQDTATSLASMIGLDNKGSTAVASTEPVKTSTPTAAMPKPSLAFKRNLAGV